MKKRTSMAEKIDSLRGVLRDTRCVCGGRMPPRKAFCSKCLKVLGAQEVRAMRYKLQATEIDKEMVEGYEACLAWLVEHAYVREGTTL